MPLPPDLKLPGSLHLKKNEAVIDPGFPRWEMRSVGKWGWGGQLYRGCANLLFGNIFDKNFVAMNKIVLRDERVHKPSASFGSATARHIAHLYVRIPKFKIQYWPHRNPTNACMYVHKYVHQKARL